MKHLLILSGKGGTGKTTVASAFIKLAEAQAFADSAPGRAMRRTARKRKLLWTTQGAHQSAGLRKMWQLPVSLPISRHRENKRTVYCESLRLRRMRRMRLCVSSQRDPNGRTIGR